MRKARIPPTKKSKFRCQGGPLDGETLWLVTNGTLPFTLNGVTGRYLFNKWEPL